MTARSGEKVIGEIGADASGRWIFQIEKATYAVDMMEAFEALQNAHIATL
jgi:hypothetical protein